MHPSRLSRTGRTRSQALPKRRRKGCKAVRPKGELTGGKQMKRAIFAACAVIAVASAAAAQTYGSGSSGSQYSASSGAEYNIPWDQGTAREINGELMWFD